MLNNKLFLILGVIVLIGAVVAVSRRQINPPQPTNEPTPSATESAPPPSGQASPTAAPYSTPVTMSIKEGTQLHVDADFDIAVGGIFDNKAWLNFHKRGLESTKRDVIIGDKFEIYGYMIEVKSMRANTSLSLAPGSSNGSVSLVIFKK